MESQCQTRNQCLRNSNNDFRITNSDKNCRKNPRRQEKPMKGKILVINGVPEWLKSYSIKKFGMLSEFNTKLNQIISTEQTNLVVFTFWDSKERNKTFLSKIFSDSILENYLSVKTINFNPVTEKNIKKILQYAVSDSGIAIDKFKLEDIIKNSGKDIRHALQTLQFHAAGKMGCDNLNHAAYKHKRSKILNKRSSNRSMDSEDFFTTPAQNKKANIVILKEEEKEKSSKDFGLSIFHALGKFLYNKRIDPSNGKARMMNSKEMKAKPKPRSYINHQKILNQVETENHVFSLFLEENMYDFYEDIEDMAKVLDVYSDNDSISTVKDYSFANSKYYNEVQDQWSLTEALAITEYNIHGGNQTKRTLKKMGKPEWFDFKRQLSDTRTLVSECTKLEQIRNGKIISTDLLLGSTPMIYKEYLPYLDKFGFIQKFKIFSPLKELTYIPTGKHRNFNNLIDETEPGVEEEEEKFKEALNQSKKERIKASKKKDKVDGFATARLNYDTKATIQEEEIENSSCEELDIDDEDLKSLLEDGDLSLSDD